MANSRQLADYFSPEMEPIAFQCDDWLAISHGIYPHLLIVGIDTGRNCGASMAITVFSVSDAILQNRGLP